MGNGRNRLDYQAGQGNEGIKTIHGVREAEMFIVGGITDGEGKKSNRMVFRIHGDKTFYFLFAKGVEENMRPAAGWLQEILEERIDGAREIASAPIPEDLVTDVPVGDPLEA